MSNDPQTTFRQRACGYKDLLPATLTPGSQVGTYFENILRQFYEYDLGDKEWEARLQHYYASEFDPSFSFLDMIVAEKKAVEFLEKCKPFMEIIKQLDYDKYQLQIKLDRIRESAA